MDQTVAVIGYGTASVNTIIALRSSGYEGRILVFSDTGILPYSPVLTSYYAGGVVPYERCFPWSPAELESLDVEVHANCPVRTLDPDAHLIHTACGDFGYTKCLVASGASPTCTGFPKIEGYSPLVLRTMDDADHLRTALEHPDCRRILVSGTSMVALKSVEACLDRGVSVTLLGRAAHILKRCALSEVAQRFEQMLRADGVELLLGQTAESAHCISDVGDRTHTIEVSFSSGATKRFDEIIVAHGMEPNLGFVPDGTLKRDAGLLVDRNMRTSDADVYAAGDVAQALELTSGEQRVVGLWKDACVQGACAGHAIAAELAGRPLGEDSEYAGAMPNNSISVCKTVLISGGTVELNPRRHVNLEERAGDIIASVYEQGSDDDDERLVGFNVLSGDSTPGSAAYVEGAMLMQRLTE